MERQLIFRDIEVSDYESSKTLLSFLTKECETFSLETFTKVCSSLNSNHRIICCFYSDIEAETIQLVAMGTILIENKLIHNCSCVGHIEDVVVHEKYRNMKLGKTLIDHLVNVARQKGVYKVILNCSKTNVEFYEKCGFHNSNVEMRINI